VGFCLHDMALVAIEDEQRLVGHLGPDLLSPHWTDSTAATAAQRLRAQPDLELGLALLGQRIMAGIGNLYKTEMCFLLGVSPWLRSVASIRVWWWLWGGGCCWLMRSGWSSPLPEIWLGGDSAGCMSGVGGRAVAVGNE
jgi:hypothetical protein